MVKRFIAKAVINIYDILSFCWILLSLSTDSPLLISFIRKLAVMSLPKSKKRAHSVERNREEGEVSNKDLLIAISALTNKTTSLECSLTKMVDEEVAGLEKIVMDQINEYKQGTNDRVRRIEKRMEEFEHQVTVDMNTARDEHGKQIDVEIAEKIAVSVSNATSGVSDSRIDQLERQVRMNELVISGLPYSDNERVIDIVSSIFEAVKFPGRDAIESCFRLPSHNNRRRAAPSVIVKFWGTEAKMDFFKRYFDTKKLCTTMIGFTAPSRIYVKENLTKRNFEIFCKARDLKKDGKIVRFSTQRVRVVVKLQGSEKSFTIDTLDQLSSLVEKAAAAPIKIEFSTKDNSKTLYFEFHLICKYFLFVFLFFACLKSAIYPFFSYCT